MKEYTSPLRNGAKLPDHPADTTARIIVKYGEVTDARTGTICVAGLHNQEIQLLMGKNPIALSHLCRYAIRDGRIYHTRSRVVIEVETEDRE